MNLLALVLTFILFGRRFAEVFYHNDEVVTVGQVIIIQSPRRSESEMLALNQQRNLQLIGKEMVVVSQIERDLLNMIENLNSLLKQIHSRIELNLTLLKIEDQLGKLNSFLQDAILAGKYLHPTVVDEMFIGKVYFLFKILSYFLNIFLFRQPLQCASTINYCNQKK